MIIIFIRSIIIYVIIVCTVRIMGKRQIGQLQPSELVVTILISNIATMAIEDATIPLFSGVIPILVFMSLEIISSEISMHSKAYRNIVSGSPKIVIRNGKIIQKELKNLRFTVEDLFEELRLNDVFDINEVLFALVETNGELSVYKKSAFQNATKNDTKTTEPDEEPPILVVSNGDLLEQNITVAGTSEKKIIKHLEKNKTKLKDVLIMTCQEKNKFSFVRIDSNE